MHIISIICNSFFHSEIKSFYYNIFIHAILINIVFFFHSKSYLRNNVTESIGVMCRLYNY